MKKRNGFTLVELLATIVILGVIMTIAVSNVVSTLDKNKKDSFIKDAKAIISAAEYKIRSDTRIEYPDNTSVVIFTLASLKNIEFEVSPYNTYYSKKKSFVALTKESVGTDYEIIYYVHLVSCLDEECSDEDNYEDNRGINLTRIDDLNQIGKYDKVINGEEVELNLLDDTNYYKVKTITGKSNVILYK